MNGEKFIKIDGDLIRESIIVLKTKLSITFFSFKKKISPIKFDKKINEKKIQKKIKRENKNCLIKYLIKIFGVYLFVI